MGIDGDWWGWIRLLIWDFSTFSPGRLQSWKKYVGWMRIEKHPKMNFIFQVHQYTLSCTQILNDIHRYVQWINLMKISTESSPPSNSKFRKHPRYRIGSTWFHVLKASNLSRCGISIKLHQTILVASLCAMIWAEDVPWEIGFWQKSEQISQCVGHLGSPGGGKKHHECFLSGGEWRER